jgi:hypothetical protein
MTDYPSLDQIEVVLRSGRGVAIVCEGNSPREDEAIFASWFADLSRDVTFHAQDGWKFVEHAVNELRRRGVPVPVFGLLDRDFLPDEDLGREGRESYGGPLFHLPAYDIEGYLLSDPNGWLDVLRYLHKREKALPQAWSSAADVRAHIHACYQEALPAAAHNWTVQALDAEHHGRPGFAPRKYLADLTALSQVPLPDALAAWATPFGAEQDAMRIYGERLDFLQGLPGQAELSKYVSGKIVYRRFHQLVPFAPGRSRLDRVYLADLYIEKHPEAPAEVAELVRRIIALGRAELAVQEQRRRQP